MIAFSLVTVVKISILLMFLMTYQADQSELILKFFDSQCKHYV